MRWVNTAIAFLSLAFFGLVVAAFSFVVMKSFGMGSASGGRCGGRREAHDSNVDGLNNTRERL